MMSRDDIETNFIEELGLSDDSDLDPDFVPHSEKDNLCESPTLSRTRSQRAQARQAEKDGIVYILRKSFILNFQICHLVVGVGHSKSC